MAEKKKESFESVVMDHLRMDGANWGLTTLALLDKLVSVSVDELVSWLLTCQHESGGFAGNTGHDPHVLYTLSALQILALFDKLDILDVGKINVKKAVDYILSCRNLDGGFGCTPGAESHAGQIFCGVGALAITGSLHHVDKDLLGWWLCERQVKSGGLNGRPEKLPDVGVKLLSDKKPFIEFIGSTKQSLSSSSWTVRFVSHMSRKVVLENGGISDRPDDAVDIFHTYFGVAGLSLLEYPGVQAIDPAYALPVDVINRIILNK
ncbi:hypothetical protein Bca4012_016384 [Brassica carinata]